MARYRLSSWESGGYHLQMITFQRFRNATIIAAIETPEKVDDSAPPRLTHINLLVGYFPLSN